MRKFLIAVILATFLGLTSCYQNNKQEASMPEYLIPRVQMIEMLTQIQLAEGKVVLEREKNKDYRLTGKKYTEAIYLQFGVTSEQFIENLNYYQNKEGVLVDIYDEVLANLSTMQDEVKIKMAEERLKIKTDSIHQADSLALLLSIATAEKQDSMVVISKPNR